MLEAKARARFLRGSARKMRQVVDLVRGKRVNEALNMLSVLPKSAAGPVRKTVQSAAANALAAEGTAHLKSEDLKIARITVDGGPSLKRIRPMGMGRAFRINKRLCHLTVVLEGDPLQTAEAAGGRKAKAPAGSAARARATAAAAKSGTTAKPARSAAPKTGQGRGARPKRGQKDGK
jgi:large subunit ribosomal protein L22